MKYALILAALLLVGCETVPSKPKWPAAPDVGTCAELSEAIPSDKLSELLKTVTENYGKYHECSARIDAWQQWYKEQKSIYEKTK